jgi:hypothetical protein
MYFRRVNVFSKCCFFTSRFCVLQWLQVCFLLAALHKFVAKRHDQGSACLWHRTAVTAVSTHLTAFWNVTSYSFADTRLDGRHDSTEKFYALFICVLWNVRLDLILPAALCLMEQMAAVPVFVSFADVVPKTPVEGYETSKPPWRHLHNIQAQ